MGRNLKLLISALSLSALYGIYYFGIPAVVNSSSCSYEKIIEKELGFKSEIKNPKLKMGFLPAIKLSADNFAILNDDNSKAFYIENVNLNLRLLPLLFKNINIKNFSADKLNIGLVFDKKLTLGQYDFNNLPEQKLHLNKASVNIKDYDIYLDDKTLNKKLKLDGQYFRINDFKNKKHINLSTEANLYSGSKISELKADINIKLPADNLSENGLTLSGYIKNLDLSDFSPYAKSISQNKIKSLSGIINLNTEPNQDNQIKTSISIKNLGIFQDNIETSIYSKDEIKINGNFKALNNGLGIDNLKITGKDINSEISGEITKLNHKIPTLDLKIGVDNTKAEKVIPLLPGMHDLSPDMDFLLLKKAGFWGDASANLEIKGKADYPNVFGDVLIKNAYMVKPIPNSKKGIIKLIFKGDKFDLDVVVPTSPTQTVWVKGPINLDIERTADLKITSTDSVDLKTAQIVLNPLHEILHFDLGPVPIMDIKGLGGIDLHITGTKKDPHGWGEFKFKNATVSFLDIYNLEINNGSGSLKFEDQNTKFESKTAILNGKPISIKGTCSLLGDLNFDVTSNNQDLGKLLKSIQTSPMLKDVQELIKPIESASGNADVILNLTGKVKDVNDIVFNKNLFAKGSIKLLGNKIKPKDASSLSNISGLINFKNLDANFDLKSALGSSLIKIDGLIKNNICNVNINSNKLSIGDLVSSAQLPYSKKDLSTINVSFNAKYNGKIDPPEYDKVNIKGTIFSNKNSHSSIIIDNNANFELSNSNLKISQIKGKIDNNPYNLSLNASKIFSPNRIVNGYGKVESFDLSILKNETFKDFLPSDISKQLSDIEFINGKIDISARAKNNNLNLYTVLDNISLLYKPENTKLSFNSGNILLQNNTLNLNKLNARIDEMPVFVDGKIFNVYKKPTFKLYLNTKPTQDFLDQFFNKNSIYPIKIKGDAIFSSNINGSVNNLNTKSVLDIKENSSLYYMGATIGDFENPVKITLDNTYSPNRIKINNLKYDKIIMSQNNKPFVNTQLNASGNLSILKDNIIGFNNFKIKTENPTDAKIFNIIFRKPFMKQGVFSSDIIINGTSLNPKINGKFDITSIDIPFFDSTIRDLNIEFKPDKIFIASKGKVLTNDVILDAIMKNKLTPPYVIENIKLDMADLNVNKITDAIRDLEAEATKNKNIKNSSAPFDISQLIINNAEVQANKIHVRNIDAEKFFANLKINEKSIANVDNFKFNIAKGTVNGNIKYNLLNQDTNISIHLNDANANIMSEALFDLKGQVYGSINGDFDLFCNGKSNDNCFKTLTGKGNFKIADGRMPKLGSLEYLLKAGNLFKGGITGLSINSLVDLITPLKTGNFESISGDINIKEGIADKISIYSKGNDLNMYMTGSYNIANSLADMKIFGSLSKNITTVFGKLKNVSLNTLFNTIPGINDSTEKLILQSDISKIPNIKDVTDIYRIFAVEINGDINGTDYVKSFKWVK